MSAAIFAGYAGKVNDHEDDGDYPQGDAAIKHRKDAVIGGECGGGNGYRHNPCRCALERTAVDLGGKNGEEVVGNNKQECASEAPVKEQRNKLAVTGKILQDVAERP